MCDAVRESGAVPAVTAVVGGRASLGIDDATLERFLTAGAPKVSARDLAWAMASGGDGATTVAGALAIASAGTLDVFSTGGIGGVHLRTHPDAPFDESADLLELAHTSMVVVCAGAKSILDLAATVERLESYGVSVIGYRTDEFPGFFTARTGLPVGAVAQSADDIARAFLASRALGRRSALLVVRPPPEASALDPKLVDDAVGEALAAARTSGVRGAAVTPFLLAAVERATGGRSVATNLALLEENARLAGQVAVAIRSARLAG